MQQKEKLKKNLIYNLNIKYLNITLLNRPKMQGYESINWFIIIDTVYLQELSEWTNPVKWIQHLNVSYEKSTV